MLYARQYSYLKLMTWCDAFCAALGLLLAYALRFVLSGWYSANMSGLPVWFPAILPYEEGFVWRELLWTLPAVMLTWPLALGHLGLYDPEKQHDWKARRILLLQGSLLSTVTLVVLIFVFKLEYAARVVIIGTGFITAALLELKELLLRKHRGRSERQDDFHRQLFFPEGPSLLHKTL